MADVQGHNYGQQTDAEFLRSIAHAIDIGDPVETSWVARLRTIADTIQANDEQAS